MQDYHQSQQTDGSNLTTNAAIDHATIGHAWTADANAVVNARYAARNDAIARYATRNDVARYVRIDGYGYARIDGCNGHAADAAWYGKTILIPVISV